MSDWETCIFLCETHRSEVNRLLKNAHLLRPPHPSLLRRTYKYDSLLRISGALHLNVFKQPLKRFVVHQ